MGNTNCNCCGTGRPSKKERALIKAQNNLKSQDTNLYPQPSLESAPYEDTKEPDKTQSTPYDNKNETKANTIGTYSQPHKTNLDEETNEPDTIDKQSIQYDNTNDAKVNTINTYTESPQTNLNVVNIPSPKELEIDFSIFGVISTNCSKKSTANGIISSCSYLQRIASGLKYFKSISGNGQTETSRNSFVEFCMAYGNIIEDLIHLVKEHDDADQLIQINNELQKEYGFKKCDISNCNVLKQHYGVKDIDSKSSYKIDNSDNNEDNVKFNFYQSCYHRMHHHIFHLLPMGLRVKTKSNYNDVDMKEHELTDIHSSCVDQEFERRRDLIKKRSIKCGLNLEKYNDENNKYNLCVSTDSKSDTVLSTLFSTGFIFYYWDSYKSLTKDKIRRYDENFKDEINNGYSIAELSVSPHHKTLKDEMIESEFIDMYDWNNKIVFKAEEYYQTNKVMNMKAGKRPDYGIRHEAPISLSHLQCIILYCDCHDLCSHFRATFQMKDENESIKSLINRHSKYYHFARGLIEAVNDFGLTGGFLGSYSPNTEQGPFYCGLAKKLCIPSMSIYLKGPCSTSKNMEVCINLSKDTGMIMQLQNDQWGQGAKQRFFDCSWISNYSGESERLFIAGSFRLKIQSVILIQTGQNFVPFSRAFYLFDHMVSAGGFLTHAVTETVEPADVEILGKMINNRICDDSEKKDRFDEFVENTFDSLLFSKEGVRINMYYLDSEFKKINHLIVHSVVAEIAKYDSRNQKWTEYEQRSSDDNDSSDTINIINTKACSIFRNLNHVVINTTYNGDIDTTPSHYMYRFNLLSFLSAIQAYEKKIKYIITAAPKAGKSGGRIKDSWLEDAFSDSIQQEYNDKGWDIDISKELSKKGRYDKLTIEKMS